MNIQEEVQKIHTHFGISEMGNYQIQLLFDKYNKNLTNKINRELQNKIKELEQTIENMKAIAGEKIEPVATITSVNYPGRYNARGTAGEFNQRQLEIIKENNEMMHKMFGLIKVSENNPSNHETTFQVMTSFETGERNYACDMCDYCYSKKPKDICPSCRRKIVDKKNNQCMNEMFGLHKELENNTTEIVSKHKGYYSTTIHSCKKCNTEILRTSYNFCPSCGRKFVK